MCGLSGFVDLSKNSDIDILNKMISSLTHRGPDDSGVEIFRSEHANVGLGHNRLSIIDLSTAGHQPMSYFQYSIILNGEIYNYSEIKKDLLELGHEFVSETDTEVVLHSFAEWGPSCVSKFIGMFVFVIFNKDTLELTIIRDRAGVKPLFYYKNKGLFLFSSELKAFHHHPMFEKRINVNSIGHYMDFGYIPAPYCIFENCSKLEPGHILKFNIIENTVIINKYWDVKDYYRLPTLKVSYDEAKNEVEKLLTSACEYRMVSDVPVGIFLSGGFDSTAVAALLQNGRKEQLKTFTIGFENGNNEAPHAKNIANYLGTNHTEYYCTTKDAQDIISELPIYYDEPFADSSAIPTILVSKMAKKNVTVALSADAGDEIFAGYNIYKTFQRDSSLIQAIPACLRKPLGKLLDIVSAFTPLSRGALKDKFSAFSKVLQADNNTLHQVLFRKYFSVGCATRSQLFRFNPSMPKTIFDYDFRHFSRDLSIPLAIDYSIYLQNDILTKVDRATMSVSLEGREPFLDHRIIEYVAQLPVEFKYGDTQKKILKDIVYKYIPKHLMDRPKTGFTIPIYDWLRTDLNYLIQENLDALSIEKSGVFNFSFVEKLLNSYKKNELKDQTIIWKLLQFQLWYKKWM